MRMFVPDDLAMPPVEFGAKKWSKSMACSQLSRFLRCLVLIYVFTLASAGQTVAQTGLPVSAGDPYPLRGADTSSPRETLRSFLYNFKEGVDAWLSGKNNEEFYLPIARATETIDFSDVPMLGRADTIAIDMALLQEVLDRVDIPPLEDIPGSAEIAAAGNNAPARWSIPNTRIEIVRIEDGPQAGKYLFSRETVANLKSYYSAVSNLPYKVGGMVGLYESVLASPGPWFSPRFVQQLPRWATFIVVGQSLWKWIAAAILIMLCVPLFAILIWTGLRWDQRQRSGSPWVRFGTPLALFAVVALSGGFYSALENGVGLLEGPLAFFGYVTLSIKAIGLSCLAWTLSDRFADGFATIGRQPDRRRHFDAALLRLLFRLISLVVMVLVLASTSEQIGIPLAPLLTGLGVGGLAIALAIRPTLENLIGGLTLFADRPIRIGDFCRFGDDVGTVEEIGLRSTRIRTPEESIVTVPNSTFSQLPLDNFTARKRRLSRILLQLSSETTTEQLRSLLATLRELLSKTQMVVPDLARVRFVGYGVHSRTIEVFCYFRCEDENTFLALQEDLLLMIEDAVQASGSALARPTEKV